MSTMEKKLKVLSLFDGISTGYKALTDAGYEIEKYYASEIEATSIQMSTYNYPDIIRLGDVTKYKEWGIDWSSIDVLIGGSPCQSVSFAGQKTGFEGKSGLFMTYVEILNLLKEKNPNIKFFLENVKMKKEFESTFTSLLGVEPVRINSKDFSAQQRDRLYWCNWKIDKSYTSSEQVLKDIVGTYDKKYYLSKTHYDGFMRSYNWKACSLEGKSKALLASYYKQPPHCPYIPCSDSPSGYRRLTPTECELLQTLPKDWTRYGIKDNKKVEMSDTARYKAIGNGWTLSVITWIFKTMY